MASLDVQTVNQVKQLSGDICGGFLYKRAPSGVVRSWSSRFFVLTEDQLQCQIKYYTDSERTECKGTIDVHEITEIRDVVEVPKSMLGSNDNQPPELRFDVVMKDRTYELCALKAEHKRMWLKQLVKYSHIPLASDKGTEYIMQGYLVKLSNGSSRQKWDRRYFRLRNDDIVRALLYYKNENESTPQGTIEVSDVMEVREYSHETENIDMSALSGWVPPYDTRFEVKIHGRVYILAESNNRSATLFSSGSGGAEKPEIDLSTVVSGPGSKDKWVAKLAEVCEVEVNREVPNKSDDDEDGEGMLQLDENGVPILPDNDDGETVASPKKERPKGRTMTLGSMMKFT